ncbi:growth inhibitor [Clostridium sp. ASBs410]|nr:growth inhibitor [Clostridium sp. ASBs410]
MEDLTTCCKKINTSTFFVYNGKNDNKPAARNIKDVIKCCEIRWAYLPEVGVDCHMQRGKRPVLIVSNNMNNKAVNGNVHVIPFTSKEKKYLPTHTYFQSGQFGLPYDSILLAECETQIPSCYVYDKIGYIDDLDVLERIAYTMDIQKGIYDKISKLRNERVGATNGF